MSYKEDYDALRNQYKDSTSLMYKKLKIVDSYINPGKTLLDIGIGVGELINLEKNKFEFIYGFDVDQEAVDFCKTRFKGYNNINIGFGDLSDLKGMFNQKFDCITCLDVLEHVEVKNCAETIENIHELLNENGIFIFTGPGIFEKVRIKLGLSPTHKHSHSSYSWEKMIRQSGFKIYLVESIEFPIYSNNFLRKKFHLFGKCCLIIAKRD